MATTLCFMPQILSVHIPDVYKRQGWHKVIDVKGLKKNYGGLQVLKGVDLTIDKGDCVVLVGPSGCGKSTFLRCLNRLEEPDGGEVIFNGKAVTDHDIDHVRQKMGTVSYTHLDVYKRQTIHICVLVLLLFAIIKFVRSFL